ncbi:hypothetical protein AVEN_165821-1 [Araneus ventricosus]|uniref:Uncharacterized protein n=1 Tax=Araneus ventricosus TaxID=182803 RepID=A0A4Y2ELS0_ARAVE|nr:hypothetical protein AVEN_165821-1 [Araneus ventricosus]
MKEVRKKLLRIANKHNLQNPKDEGSIFLSGYVSSGCNVNQCSIGPEGHTALQMPKSFQQFPTLFNPLRTAVTLACQLRGTFSPDYHKYVPALVAVSYRLSRRRDTSFSAIRLN